MSTPNPASTDWVPIWSLGGGPSIPTPVVNGQWLKGSGGAVIWSPITPADISGYPNNRGQALRGDGQWRDTWEMVQGNYGNNVKLQAGQTVINVPASANTTIVVNLPAPWPTGHLGFWGSAWPQAAWNGVNVLGVGLPANLSQGQIQISNSSGAQNFTVFWLSIGY